MVRRSGFALVVALLVVSILSIAAAGILALGLRESEIAGAMARRSAARLAAESAAGMAVAGWSTRRYGELLAGEASGALEVPGRPGSGAAATAAASYSVTRLGPVLYLVRGAGRHPDPELPATGHAGLLVRTVDGEALATGFPAAVVATGEARLDGGVVDGGQPCLLADGAPGATAIGAAGVLAPQMTISPAALVTGVPPTMLAPPPPLAMPELFGPPLLHALVTAAVTGDVVTPGPRHDQDGCRAGPSNWGAISNLSPCHGHLPFVHATGHLAVWGGEGRGFLLVEGDLDLEDVRFHGVILVRGRLTIAAGTAIRGAIRAASVHVQAGSVTHDPCAVASALTAGGLDRPFRPRHRLWLPVF